MRLSFSNIAWAPEEDALVAELLAQHEVDAIDVAPGKYFPNPADATADDIRRVRKAWDDRGIGLTGMQALLFGTAGLNVFGTAAVQGRLLDHLAHICRIGQGLGATRLVFGSPKNRDRTGLNDDETLGTAVDFFRRLGGIAEDHGTIICLEPNPPCYGANFMTTATETAQVVRSVNHPAVRMQLDTGALTINGEDPREVVTRDHDVIAHVHASEPNLRRLGTAGTDHASMAAALIPIVPNLVVAIEMLPTPGESHLDSMAAALRVATACYRPSPQTPR